MAEQRPGYFEPVGPLSEMVLPQTSSEATEGKVVRWLKQQEEAIERGEPVVEVAMGNELHTIAATDTGILWRYSVEAGAVISPGARLGWLLPDNPAPARLTPPEKNRLWEIITVLALIGTLIFALLTIILAIHA